jgi:hypothetical protein
MVAVNSSLEPYVCRSLENILGTINIEKQKVYEEVENPSQN